MHYKIPVINGLLDMDYADLIEAITLSETEAVVKVHPSTKARDGWIEIAEGDFVAVKPTEPTPQPSEMDVIGQQLVEKDLQIMALQQENEMLGQQLVDMDLRLLAGGL